MSIKYFIHNEVIIKINVIEESTTYCIYIMPKSKYKSSANKKDVFDDFEKCVSELQNRLKFKINRIKEQLLERQTKFDMLNDLSEVELEKMQILLDRT